MNSRPWLIVSVVVNLALGALVYRAFQARPPVVSHSRPVRAAALVATSNAVPVAEVIAVTPGDLTFDWAQLVAADFKVYRDNLRAIGCPEPTVRDIITAEINALYLQRRRDLMAEVQRRFWDIIAKQEDDFSKREWEKPLKNLKEEREALIAAVLGDEPKNDEADHVRRKRWAAQQYAFLPAEKRAQLVVVEDKLEEQQQLFWKTINKHSVDQLNPVEQGQLAAFTKARDAARDQLLTPAEKAEWELRQSGAANWASNLPGFEPTEAEWRAVATTRKIFDEAVNHLSGATKEEKDRQRQELYGEVQKEIAATLGPDRFAQYELAGNGSYQQTRRITHRYNLPEATAQQTYEMQRAAEASVKRLRDDPSLDPAARQAALAAIRQETERSLTTALGANVFGTYQKYNGGWLNQLAPPPAE